MCVRACVRGYVLHGSSLVLCYTTLIGIRASRGAREDVEDQNVCRTVGAAVLAIFFPEVCFRCSTDALTFYHTHYDTCRPTFHQWGTAPATCYKLQTTLRVQTSGIECSRRGPKKIMPRNKPRSVRVGWLPGGTIRGVQAGKLFA